MHVCFLRTRKQTVAIKIIIIIKSFGSERARLGATLTQGDSGSCGGFRFSFFGSRVGVKYERDTEDVFIKATCVEQTNHVQF